MMSSKGFFSFFKSSTKDTLSEEDLQQRSYALEKEKEEAISSTITPYSLETTEATVVPSPQAEEEGPGVSDEIRDFCIDKLSQLLDLSQLGGTVEIIKNSNNTLVLDIVDSEDLGRTIGKAGATLDSLQTLVRTFAYRQFETPFRLSIDAGEYKKKKTFNSKKRYAKQKVAS